MGKKERHAEQRAIDLEQRRLAKEAEREARRRAWHAEHQAELESRRRDHDTTTDPLDDPHTIKMAARNGITPAAFLELQEQRRSEMDAIARKGDVGQQLSRLRPIDVLSHEVWPPPEERVH